MKLFSKIATVLAGFSLALGVGVAATSLGKGFKEAQATTGTASINFKKTDQVTEASADVLTYTASPVTISAAKGSQPANNYYPGTAGKTYTSTRFYSNSVVTISAGANYIKNITFTATGENYAGVFYNSEWTDGTPSISGAVVTIAPANNVHSVSVVIGGTCGFNSASVDWDSEASTDPVITVSTSNLRVAKDGSNTFTATYANLTSSLAVVPSDASIASVSFAPVASGSGNVTITVDGLAEGETTITLSSSGAESVEVALAVYIPVTFVEIDNVSRLVNGTRVIVVATESNHAMGSLRVSNMNSIEITKVDNAKGESTTTIDPGVVSVFELNKSTAEGCSDYYSFKNVANNKYLCAASSSANQLKECESVDANASFDIQYAAGATTIVAKGSFTRNTIRYNSTDDIFSCYSTTQNAITLYMLGDELPAGTNVASITNVQLSSDTVENGESITLTATYAPSNATEQITVTVSDLSEGNADIGVVSMSNGQLSVEITATATGEVMLMVEAAANSISVDSDVLTITPSMIIYNSGTLTGTSVDIEVGSANEIAGLTWYNTVFTPKGEAVEMGTNAKGMQIGQGAKPVTSFELTSQLFVGTDYASKNACLIDSIIIDASVANDGDCDMSVYLDDSQIGTTIALTNVSTEYKFDVGAGVGHIRIAFENNVDKAFFLKSIVVRGINDGDNSELYKIAQELELLDSCNVTASEWNAFKAKNNAALDATYEEAIEVYDADFSIINLYDHASKNPTSLKVTNYGALAKYNFIEGELNGGTPSRITLGLNNNNTMTLVIIIASITMVSGFAFFFVIKRRKHN